MDYRAYVSSVLLILGIAACGHKTGGSVDAASLVDASNQAVPFVGLGRDVEDGDLTGASLVWTSSIDGALGTGTMFNKVLSVGIHAITLTATDSASNADSATITLTIQ